MGQVNLSTKPTAAPSDLVQQLNAVKNILTTEGIFVAEVPHVDLRIHNEMRGDSPHLSFFSIDSMRILFESNDWQILFLSTVGPTFDTIMIPEINFILRFRRSTMIQLLSKVRQRLNTYLFRLFGKKALSNHWIRNENYNYGGNRTLIRIVAKVLKTS